MPPPGLLYMPCQSHVASGLPAACPLAGLFYKIEPNSPSCGMMCHCKAQHLVTAPALPVRSLPPPLPLFQALPPLITYINVTTCLCRMPRCTFSLWCSTSCVCAAPLIHALVNSFFSLFWGGVGVCLNPSPYHFHSTFPLMSTIWLIEVKLFA